MPFIPYPDVPSLPGVPALPQPPAGLTIAADVGLGALEAFDQVSLDNTPPWQITDGHGRLVLDPDSVIEFEYRAEMKIPTYPIEGGSFQSYNKIPIPYDIRMTVACNGNGSSTRQQILLQLENLRASLATAVIITPDAVYGSVNLVHFDYRRESRQGVTLLLIQLWFQEIRVAQQVQTQTAQPDGTDPSQNGQVSPVSPTADQASSIRTITQEEAAGFSPDAVVTTTNF